MTTFDYFGPYKAGELLGRGGMGSVYEAVHAKTGERVAVKVIAQQLADEERFRRRFDGEIKTLLRLRHKNIVQILGTGEQQDHLFYVMELVEGESLQQKIRRDKRIDWQVAIDIAIQVASALKHAHDIGAIHRDLKPANLLLTASGTVKLVDFGIAKLFGEGEQTVAGSVLGTADYMAPEQADSGPITPRTDLYALGSVLYAMLSGRAPFTGKRLTEVMQSLKRDRPVPLELVNPELPEALIELVHQLLEKDPSDRPPTALAVMKRLQAMRAGLQRGQTMDDRERPTASNQSRPELSDGFTRESLSGEVLMGASSSQTNVDQPGTIATGSTPPEKRAASDDVTAASEASSGIGLSGASTVIPATEPPKPAKTHFQTVDSSRAPETLFGSQDSSDSHWWIQWLSILAMIAILLGGIGLIISAVRTPSADTLYERIIKADGEGDLLAERALIKQFTENYPDDARQAEIDELSDSLELEQYLRQLRTKANRDGGIERLEPAEQAFLDAMSQRGRRPEIAMKQLQAWLSVFEHRVSPSDFSIRRMAIFAEAEIERLREQSRQTVQLDRRVDDLLSRIEWAKANLGVEDRRQLLTGIMELYRNKAWATSVVDRAKKELASLPPVMPVNNEDATQK